MILAPHAVVVKSVSRGALVIAAASLLAGCISLFPQTEPAQLYRFGVTMPQVQEATSGEPGFGVLLAASGFDRAAAGDRILTVTGTQAAYIKDARWVAASVGLFDSALQRAFDADKGPARLVDRAEIVHADYVLKLDVRTFEARYDHGQVATPTIVVEVHAALDRTQDRTVVGDRSFSADVTASDNRVGAIAEAFDQAVARVLGELVSWVNARGEG
ncbi:MAG: membrane integrity-associated transporter subunit PqiC [Proteobacteria bacterium]|nr:membrane integrity-associated transporter subunit PqiC [Pseudomonadota bacterium]